MKKEEISAKVNEFCTESCASELEHNDKNSGTSAPLEKNDVFTIIEGDFFPSKTEYESQKAATDAGVTLTNRNVTIVPKMDGETQVGETVVVDNSYYGVRVDGNRQAISLRMLTSWSLFPRKDVPDTAMHIPGGKSSEVFARLAEYKGKKIRVVKTASWEKGKEFNGRVQQYAGSAAIFEVVNEG